MPITPVAGPAGSGKSQYVARRLRRGEVVLDYTRLWAALAGVERGPDGRLPERRPDDPLIPLVQAVFASALVEATRRGLNGYVTTASRGAVADLVTQTGQPAVEIDPGDDVAVSRLMTDDPDPPAGQPRRALPRSCSRALARWYGDRRTAGGAWRSSSGREYPIRGGGGRRR